MSSLSRKHWATMRSRLVGFDLPSHGVSWPTCRQWTSFPSIMFDKDARGLVVAGLAAFRGIDAANPDAYATGFRFHREGVAVDDRGYLAEVIGARCSRDRQRCHQDRHVQFHCNPYIPNPTYDSRRLPEPQNHNK